MFKDVICVEKKPNKNRKPDKKLKGSEIEPKDIGTNFLVYY